MRLIDYIRVLEFGGPGSGCHGDNCGRPSSGNGSDLHQRLHTLANTDNLSSDQKQSLNWYQAGGDKLINGPLRSRSMSPDELREETRQFVGDSFKDIEQAFKSVDPLPHDVVLYRGVSPEFASSLSTGKELIDSGFMSTTTSTDFADKASRGGTVGGRGGPGAVIKITVPAGSRVLPMESLNDEYEVLLNRGTKLKFDSPTSAKIIP